jgi:hypothetical protein
MLFSGGTFSPFGGPPSLKLPQLWRIRDSNADACGQHPDWRLRRHVRALDPPTRGRSDLALLPIPKIIKNIAVSTASWRIRESNADACGQHPDWRLRRHVRALDPPTRGRSDLALLPIPKIIKNIAVSTASWRIRESNP